MDVKFRLAKNERWLLKNELHLIVQLAKLDEKNYFAKHIRQAFVFFLKCIT
jgi:hypothetical protein